MLLKMKLLAIAIVLAPILTAAQTPAPASAAAVWNALSAPAMDPAKSAHVENVTIARDAVHITLTDGTIQFTQPANGVVFGAVFHGNGRLEATPPNPIEARQLYLFPKQDDLNLTFTHPTFSFTDGLLDEIASQLNCQTAALATHDLSPNPH